jgi:hypothetical protein
MKNKTRSEKSLSEEYQEIIKRAQQQPGIKELSEAYGRSELLAKRSREYFAKMKPKFVTFNTTSSS